MKLTKQERRLYTLLELAEGWPVSHEAIIKVIWQGYGGSEVVRAHVTNIRRKFGGGVIDTQWGRGYRVTREMAAALHAQEGNR